MTKRLTVKSILKAAGNPVNIEMDALKDYVLLIYDNGTDVYETRSVMVKRINHLSLQCWIYEINQLIEDVKDL